MNGRDHPPAAGPLSPVAAKLIAAAVAAVALAALLATSASGAVRSAALDYGKAERVKTMPISKQAWGDTRSVMSLPPQRVGDLIAGDKVEATGDFEVTICLKPDPRHPGNGQPCVGRMYGYNPKVKAKLALAPNEGATAPEQTKPISKTFGLECRQDHPVRNHHCVVSVPWSKVRIANPDSLPCEPNSCHINMLATAYHGKAKSGEKVVVGSSDDNKRIHQGLAQLSYVRHRPGGGKPSKSWRGGRARKKLPVVSENQSIKRKVIYSAKVSRLKAGDQLVVDAKARTAIRHLPYNVFHRTEVVFAKNRKSTKPWGKISGTTARISSSNGLNCTRKRSAHSSVCEFRKGGVFSVKKKAKGPFYVNFVAGAHAIGTHGQVSKWRKSHAAKVKKRGGYVKVRRYKGSGACSTCSTGWTRFSPAEQPAKGKAATLIDQLRPFGITDGEYNCAGRTDGTYVCKWRTEGRFGRGPRYSCDTRAKMPKGANRFKLKVCKDALASQLWDELLGLPLPVEPTFTGVCNETNGGDYRCKWFGDVKLGPLAGKGCKGYATYKLPEHRWAIDPCRP